MDKSGLVELLVLLRDTGWYLDYVGKTLNQAEEVVEDKRVLAVVLGHYHVLDGFDWGDDGLAVGIIEGSVLADLSVNADESLALVDQYILIVSYIPTLIDLLNHRLLTHWHLLLVMIASDYILGLTKWLYLLILRNTRNIGSVFVHCIVDVSWHIWYLCHRAWIVWLNDVGWWLSLRDSNFNMLLWLLLKRVVLEIWVGILACLWLALLLNLVEGILLSIRLTVLSVGGVSLSRLLGWLIRNYVLVLLNRNHVLVCLNRVHLVLVLIELTTEEFIVDIQDLLQNSVLMVAKLLQDGFEGGIHVLILHRDEWLNDWLNDIPLRAMLLDENPQGLDHDSILLVVLGCGVEGLTLLDENVKDF